jgi:hypothetical protein
VSGEAVDHLSERTLGLSAGDQCGWSQGWSRFHEKVSAAIYGQNLNVVNTKCISKAIYLFFKSAVIILSNLAQIQR